MRFVVFIGLLLINFVSIASEQLAVTGEFRLNLPKRFSSAQVLLVLRPSTKDSLNTRIALQSDVLKDGQKIPILLQYKQADVDSEMSYSIDVFVRELITEEQHLIAKNSFLLDKLNKINIAINIAPQPIE